MSEPAPEKAPATASTAATERFASGPSVGAPSAAEPRTPFRPTGAAPGETAPETDLWIGRTNWRYFAPLILRTVLGLAVLAVIVWLATTGRNFLSTRTAWWILLGAAVVAALYVLARIGLAILNERYRLTTQRLFLERGILSRTQDQLELVRVDDVRISKTLLHRILGVGTVSVMTTDSSDRTVRIVGVLHPERVAEEIRTHVRACRQRSVYIEHV